MSNSRKTFFFAAVFGLIVVGALLFAATHTGQAKETSKPYKATTVDECIQEKECVWYAFAKIVLDPHKINSNSTKKAKIAKWSQDIRIDFLGKETDELKNRLSSFILRAGPYFAHDIKFNSSQANFLVVAVDDFERSSIESFRQPIIDFTKFTDVKYQFFANPYDKDRASCQIAKLEKDGNRSGFLILVNNRNNGGKKCLANNLYSSMNIRHDGLFRLSLKDFERSEENLDRITDLHLIVLGVFYSEKFPVLVDHDSARTAFSKLYPELLRRYKELRQGGREL